jgi:methylenetetrahydrofolate--tRNA-(uracil-5-)-methyltransferase
MPELVIVGAGLAGCECAWQAARFGLSVRLLEMKPHVYSPAHGTPDLAELVCSNSLRSEEETNAVGALKRELETGGSLIMACARAARLPAGKALAVDRAKFSDLVTAAIEAHPDIVLERREVESLDDPALAGADFAVVAAGPLAGEKLSEDLRSAVGDEELYFYDAIAPIVWADSIEMAHAFWGSRYRPEDDDYLNCPMNEEEYRAFVAALLTARRAACREFEKEVHFEGCMPIEALAERGDMTLAFGPLKPVGLTDPRLPEGHEHFAVLQLRAENAEKTAFNLVGCQTKLAYPEQKRVFGLIPALANAEYLRLGSVHRNTYVNAPRALNPDLSLRSRPHVRLAGQITGVEGYVESAACGYYVGLLVGHDAAGRAMPEPPPTTALGGLLGHLRTPAKNFQPSNANYGLTPALKQRAGKRKRKELYARRAREAWQAWLAEAALPPVSEALPGATS